MANGEDPLDRLRRLREQSGGEVLDPAIERLQRLREQTTAPEPSGVFAGTQRAGQRLTGQDIGRPDPSRIFRESAVGVGATAGGILGAQEMRLIIS